MENFTVTDMAMLSWQTLQREVNTRPPTSNFFFDFIEEFRLMSSIELSDVYMAFVVAIFLTIHRYIYSYIVLKPFTRSLKLNEKDSAKVVESGCRLQYYVVFYAFEYYLLNYKYPEYRWDPVTHWRGWAQGMEMCNSIKALYIIQSGFYFHAVYATVMMDTWKKDSIPMLLHHVLANSLIIFSLALRYHRLGLLVLYLHDSADVLLEGTKIIISINSKYNNNLLEMMSTIGFLVFITNWFWCRLIVYPQYVMFSAMHIGLATVPTGQFYFFFNTMLACLWALNIYWFYLMVALLVRIATGQTKVNDVREYEETGEEINGNVAGIKAHSKVNGEACGKVKGKINGYETNELTDHSDGGRKKND